MSQFNHVIKALLHQAKALSLPDKLLGNLMLFNRIAAKN